MACGKTFTCICTQGGYVYLYGNIGNPHKFYRNQLPPSLRCFRIAKQTRSTKNIGLSLPKSSQYFVNKVHTGDKLVVLQTDQEFLVAYDSCLEPIKIYVPSKIKDVSICGD